MTVRIKGPEEIKTRGSLPMERNHAIFENGQGKEEARYLEGTRLPAMSTTESGHRGDLLSKEKDTTLCRRELSVDNVE